MNKKTRRIIQAINESVPKELRDAVVTEEYIAPELRLEARRNVAQMREDAEAMEDGEAKIVALRSVQRLQNIIDAGYYDTKEFKVNKEVAAKIDAFIDAELDKAIAGGRIPHPKDDRQYKAFTRKLKQYELRNSKQRLARTQAIANDKARGSEAN